MSIPKKPIYGNQDDAATIERCPHDASHNFTMVSNNLIRDTSVSPECRWLIIFLLSNKEGWKINISQVVDSVKAHMGRDRVYAIVNEAIAAGYLKRETVDRPIGNGRVLPQVKYTVSESPKFKESLRRPDFQDPERQDPERQDPERQDPVAADSKNTCPSSRDKEEHREKHLAPTDSQARPVGAAGQPKLAFCFTSNSFVGITEQDRADWRIAYPSVKLDAELAAMRQWLLANPAKARKSQWRKFIINWLAKAQGAAVRTEAYASQAKKGKNRDMFDAQGNSLSKAYEGLF